jgi:hypothetical protein
MYVYYNSYADPEKKIEAEKKSHFEKICKRLVFGRRPGGDKFVALVM